MEIYSVEFGFENCEVIRIPARYIFYLSYKGITISRTTSSYGSNYLWNHDTVDDFTVGVLSEANYGVEVTGNMIELYLCEGNKYTITDRIDSTDLVLVDIVTWDGRDYDSIKHNQYYVHWVGDDEYHNEAVVTYMNESKDVLVRANKEIKDNKELLFEHFTKEHLDNKEFMLDIKKKLNVDWMDEQYDCVPVKATGELHQPK